MTSNRNRAVAAAMGAAAALGLTVDDAIVLQESNKLAVRLLPCDVLARVAEERIKRWAEFEVELALRLAETGSPVAAFGRAADGQKSILENSRIGGGTPAAFAAPHLGEYESQPAPSFRCRLAIAVGMEATQRCSRWKLDSG